jgi:radical SAM superfamily enzyme YgiQ (UPF0313 family)
MKNILLVSPFSDNEGLWVTGEESAEVSNNFPPLGLATLAALTPKSGYNVRIWDELVHGRIDGNTDFGFKVDLMGITGYKAHMHRCREVSAIMRSRGALTAIGGPGVSGSPHDYRGRFDVLFVNEAELTWPKFLNDWESGGLKEEYRQIEKPDLGESPLPDWSSIESDMPRYAMGTVQTTRGCPFDCEFCDVVFLFGRKPRHKPVSRVLEEVRAMRGYGFKNIFFCDDEFSGDKRYAKELLRELCALNAGLDEPLTFSSQMSIAISGDEELLGLLAEANFDLVFMGVESPNDESLKGVNKTQNLRGDMLENIHRILSYGIGIRAGMIVGFDHDKGDIFQSQYDFIQRSCLTSIGINMLKAPLGTKLWARLKREGRVVDMARNRGLGHSRSYTNIIPRMMSRVELLEGYKWLLEHVYSWESFSARVKGFVSLAAGTTGRSIKRLPPKAEESAMERLRRLAPEGAKSHVEEIIRHTMDTAPQLLRRVSALVFQHARYVQTIDALIPQVQRQIERESAGEIVLEQDDRALPAPEQFRRAYDELFPSVYKYMQAATADRELVPRLVTEVFVDFLVRWGEGFKSVEEFHSAYLKDICERAAAGVNGAGFNPPEWIAEPPAAFKTRYGDEIFKNIWMELADLRYRKASAH